MTAKTKTAQVKQQLHNDILDGVFVANEKLQINVLKDRYQVGTSPIREALYTLSTSGLVTTEQQCGFRVAQLSVDELHDIYAIREHIENLAVKLAYEKGDDHWESNIIAAYHRFTKAMGAKPFDLSLWSKCYAEFRTTIASGCDSPWLLKIRHQLHEQASRYRASCMKVASREKKILQRFYKDSGLLLEAALQRDYQRAHNIDQALWAISVNSIEKYLMENRD